MAKSIILVLRWPCVIMYPIGVNLMYGYLLFQHEDEIQDGKARHLDFLFDAYKTEYYYWEIVDNARRTTTGVLPWFQIEPRVFVAILFRYFSPRCTRMFGRLPSSA